MPGERELISDEDIYAAMPTSDGCEHFTVGDWVGAARRIESLVRKRLAERLIAYRDELELGKRDCCDQTAGVVIEECRRIVEADDER